MSILVFVLSPYEMMRLNLCYERILVTPLENMNEERIIVAAIEVLQKKLRHIRSTAQKMPSEEFKKKSQLSDGAGLLPIRPGASV